MCGGAASRELSVCLASPSPAQPSPAHLESPSIGGVVVCIVLLFAIKWDGPAWTWDGGERGTRTRTGQRWQSRYLHSSGKRYECLALATSRHCRRSSRYLSLGQSPKVQPARLTKALGASRVAATGSLASAHSSSSTWSILRTCTWQFPKLQASFPGRNGLNVRTFGIY